LEADTLDETARASNAEAPLTDEERRHVRRLLDEDAIKTLTLHYSHFLDHHYLDRLRQVFTDDVICEFGPYGSWEGIETVLANYAAVNQSMGGHPFVAMHANTQHWIEWLDRDTALGRRQLIDFDLTRTADENPLLWLGLYEDRYLRTADGWRISHMKLNFFWPERLFIENFPGHFPEA
jgi:hypothetical protein